MLSVPVEVISVRLYTKSPGSHQLRKTAAAELGQLLTAGWQEKERRLDADHIVVRLERPRPAKPSLGPVPGPGRPRR